MSQEPFELDRFVVASSQHEARTEWEHGHKFANKDMARAESERKSFRDKCNPPCEYKVWRATTMLEPVDE
jgi:hypothetical protein